MPPRRTIKISDPPDGFVYRENFVSLDDESELVDHIEKLPLREFEFHGYFGKRRTISFGWHYDFADASLNQVETIPEFLLPLRYNAAALAGLNPIDFPHVLLTEYTAGTPIGPLAMFG